MWLQLRRLKVQPCGNYCMFYIVQQCWYGENLIDPLTERDRERWLKKESIWMKDWDRTDWQLEVLQYRHVFACQSIPLWLILRGLFLAVRNLDALTHLLLHSSARSKASVCSIWPWIISYWLEFNKINKQEVLYVHASKSRTGAQYKKKARM